MNEKQKELFYEWANQCDSIKNLNCFFQNDFEQMIKNGYITKQQIKEAMVDFDNLLKANILKLQDLSGSILALMKWESL
jgi:hypothetical protein